MAEKPKSKSKRGKPKGTPAKPPAKPKTTRGKDAGAKRKSNKDAQFVLRLDRALRDRFVDACQELDTSAAREVRRFIKRFIRRYDSGELDD
jgi:hypothetical protein